MTKMKCLLFACVILISITLISASNNKIKPSGHSHIKERDNSYPGFTQIIKAVSEVIENLLAFLTGNGSTEDITKAIQDLVTEVSRMVSVEGLVGQIPVIGFILQPIVGIIAMILSHTPLMGGLISFALVGLSP